VDRLDALKTDLAARDRVQADLKDLVERPQVRRQLRSCARVYVPSHRPVPLISLYAGIAPTRVVAPAGGASGCVVVPASPAVAALAVLDPNEPTSAGGARLRGHVFANRSWKFSRAGRVAGVD
jgi:hypothetical protein